MAREEKLDQLAELLEVMNPKLDGLLVTLKQFIVEELDRRENDPNHDRGADDAK